MNFSQIEQHYNEFTNISLIFSSQKHHRFIIVFIIIIGIHVMIVCLLALYILCKSPVPYRHRIQLDYIIDPQLAKQAALKLAPEPV